jgi:hypothetical protein
MLQRKRGSQSADATADDHDRGAEILASIYHGMRWMLLAHRNLRNVRPSAIA